MAVSQEMARVRGMGQEVARGMERTRRLVGGMAVGQEVARGRGVG